MSRIGKNPIEVPQGVSVEINGPVVSIKGPKGNLQTTLHSAIAMKKLDSRLVFEPGENTEKMKGLNALWGTMRALVQNMIKGVTQGFEKKLELQGVGYRTEIKGKNIVLHVGYSHPVEMPAPEGISFTVEKNVITVSGIDKQLVGETAAQIRRVREPEPYKGKGIRYVGEFVRRKEGKVVGGSEGK